METELYFDKKELEDIKKIILSEINYGIELLNSWDEIPYDRDWLTAYVHSAQDVLNKLYSLDTLNTTERRIFAEIRDNYREKMEGEVHIPDDDYFVISANRCKMLFDRVLDYYG